MELSRSHGRRSVFALVYDADNAYFRKAGACPGWPRVLKYTLRAREDEICFRAISWQASVP